MLLRFFVGLFLLIVIPWLFACTPAPSLPVQADSTPSAVAVIPTVPPPPTAAGVFPPHSRVNLARAAQLDKTSTIEIARFAPPQDGKEYVPGSEFAVVATIRDKDKIAQFVRALDQDFQVGETPACIPDYQIRFKRADGVDVTLGYRCNNGKPTLVGGVTSNGTFTLGGEVQLPDLFKKLVAEQIGQ